MSAGEQRSIGRLFGSLRLHDCALAAWDASRYAFSIRAAAVCTLATLAFGASPALAASLTVKDTGDLHFKSVAASSILDEGTISGTLPGKGRVTFLYDGSPNVTARFTIYASGGSISGEAHCKLKDPTSLTPSFSGALKISGGSGRYNHAHGTGKLYGVFHRHGYAIDMQATGQLNY